MQLEFVAGSRIVFFFFPFLPFGVLWRLLAGLVGLAITTLCAVLFTFQRTASGVTASILRYRRRIAGLFICGFC